MTKPESVKDYYDENTPRFFRFGPRFSGHTMHRAFKSSVSNDPYRYQEELILDRIRRHKIQWVMDLGCGVGSSLLWLSRRYRAGYQGVTLSTVQASLANQLCRDTDIVVRQGSYLDPAVYTEIPEIAGPRLFYAVESWLHNPSPAGLFGRLAEKTHPGDLFIVIDDFPTARALSAPEGSQPEATIAAFRTGWRAVNLLSPDDVDRIAEDSGFRMVEEKNLGPYVNQNRWRDLAAAMAAPLLARFPSGRPCRDNIVGGAALRRASKRGWIRYLFRVWVRR